MNQKLRLFSQYKVSKVSVILVCSLDNVLVLILIIPARRDWSGQHVNTGVDSLMEALLVDPPCELSN